MATPVISYEQSLALFERWDSLSEEEQMEQQKEILKVLEEPDTVAKFTQQCKDIGQTAVAIDTSFRRVKDGFTDIVNRYGDDFPEVKNFAAQWDGFRARWDGPTGMLWSSRDLASFTSSELDLYENVFLELVARIETQQDLVDAQAELRNFSQKEHPINIDPEVADKFKDLRDDIGQFSIAFTAYLEEKKQELDKEAARLQGVIDGLVAEIEVLNEQISKILIGLAASAALGLVGLFITTAVLGGFLIARKLKQDELDDVKDQLYEVNRKQAALQHLQTEFEGLKPDIKIICDNLAIFAEVWASARSQAIDFANKLDAGMDVVTRAAFKLTLDVAKKTCKPLREGLKTYATAIVPSY